MNNTIASILLLGLLLLLLVAPFSALAPLVLVIVVSVIGLMGWKLVRAFATGQTDKDDRTSLSGK
jgi:predicted lipid-binding transport protein (Tim44 family)